VIGIRATGYQGVVEVDDDRDLGLRHGGGKRRHSGVAQHGGSRPVEQVRAAATRQADGEHMAVAGDGEAHGRGALFAALAGRFRVGLVRLQPGAELTLPGGTDSRGGGGHRRRWRGRRSGRGRGLGRGCRYRPLGRGSRRRGVPGRRTMGRGRRVGRPDDRRHRSRRGRCLDRGRRPRRHRWRLLRSSRHGLGRGRRRGRLGGRRRNRLRRRCGGGLRRRRQHFERDGDRRCRRCRCREAEQQQEHRAVQPCRRDPGKRMQRVRPFGPGRSGGAGGPGCGRRRKNGGPHAYFVNSALAREESCSRSMQAWCGSPAGASSRLPNWQPSTSLTSMRPMPSQG